MTSAPDIPWSYGADRVTAAAVDPDRLYVYWEVTDGGIARARAALAPRGDGAALVLCVHDITGRLFDGTNAHHHFDHRVERGDRQWFFTLGRPSSTAVVEIGLRADDGRFAKIARSRRVDFPRKQPAGSGEAEWMTVRADRTIERFSRASSSPPRAASAPNAPSERALEQRAEPFQAIPMWVLREVTGHEARWEESLEWSWQWTDGGGVDGATVTSWSAGPFEYPVEAEAPSSESWHGGALVYRGPTTHVIHGRWGVVIRNLSAHRERAVVSRWEIARSWRTGGGHESRQAATGWRAPATIGASGRWALGASERAWSIGSELRLGGASERFRLGASELRFAGASELRFAAASEWRLGGASELGLGGASQWLLAGASERRMRGASELRLGGSGAGAWV